MYCIRFSEGRGQRGEGERGRGREGRRVWGDKQDLQDLENNSAPGRLGGWAPPNSQLPTPNWAAGRLGASYQR
ncbi:MAG: hypothetical protein ACHBN1_32475 [Heteroscytonema crispum UTEX LB 1556]